MQLETFIANRLYFSQSGENRSSRPAIRVALAGIIIGVAVIAIDFRNSLNNGRIVAVIIGLSNKILDFSKITTKYNYFFYIYDYCNNR